MYDVVALGELLIDFTGCGVSGQGNAIFEANPGGAPGNVLAMLARLGKSTAFIGKVGQDMFGRLMTDTLKDCGIETKGILQSADANTTLAFVNNKPDGDREFSFFRKPGADTLLNPQELDKTLLQQCRIFHFGTLSLTGEPVRSATREAARLAGEAGALLSFDPNLRPPLWNSLEEAKAQMAWGCSVCNILKIADEELEFLTGEKAIASGVEKLRRQFPNIGILFVTKGKKGAEGFWAGHHFSHPSFPEVNTIDTTGAGDTFCGCCLAAILEQGLGNPSEKALAGMVVFANAAASLVTTKKGALRSMPTKAEVEALVGMGQP